MRIRRLFLLLFVPCLIQPTWAQRRWFSSRAEPTYFKLDVNLSKVVFSNPGRDPYKLNSWLGGPGKVEMEHRMRRDLRGRIPFEFEVENPDLIYRFTVFCEIHSTSVELKVKELGLRLDVVSHESGASRIVKTDRVDNEFDKVAVSLEQLKDLIMALAGTLVDRQNHYGFFQPKFIISIQGQAFSSTFSPGPLGPFEIRIQQRRIHLRLNDRRLPLVEPVRFEAVATPIFGPEASVKLTSGSGEILYLHFLDRIDRGEAERRAEQLNGWQK